jgi:hypothetical protein
MYTDIDSFSVANDGNGTQQSASTMRCLVTEFAIPRLFDSRLDLANHPIRGIVGNARVAKPLRVPLANKSPIDQRYAPRDAKSHRCTNVTNIARGSRRLIITRFLRDHHHDRENARVNTRHSLTSLTERTAEPTLSTLPRGMAGCHAD